MGKLIDFPGIEPGGEIALYTQNHIYSGTIKGKADIPGMTGIWLENATVIPIRGSATPNEFLKLSHVCVLLSQIVAFGFPPTMS